MDKVIASLSMGLSELYLFYSAGMLPRTKRGLKSKVWGLKQEAIESKPMGGSFRLKNSKTGFQIPKTRSLGHKNKDKIRTKMKICMQGLCNKKTGFG